MGFVPLVVGALFMRTPQWDIAAAALFGLASITDFFDGYIARVQKKITIYGKLMDPLADKFLVISALIMLQEVHRIHPVVVIVLICRELAITGLRALASAEGVVLAASGGAKWKTATQMVAIPFLMLKEGLWGIPLPFYAIGLVLLYFSLAMSLWSAKDYIVDFFRGVREQRKRRQAQRKEIREAREFARQARRDARARKRGMKSDTP